MIVTTWVMVALFVLAGVLSSPSRVHALRAAVNPGAPELTDGGIIVGRVIFFVLAAVGVFVALQLHASVDNAGWSDDELRTAVSESTAALDGSRRFGALADFGDGEGFDEDNQEMLVDELVEHGGGGAPQNGVGADPAPGNTLKDSRYTVGAAGASAVFCVEVHRTHRKGDDYEGVGVPGGDSVSTTPIYRIAVTSRSGEC
ncbi:hypothetical protein [Streptomyces sp. NPDC008150]|uniref:hypothetical protein n=1 Tax=Streptomyces sp. NPDC008150 TaxID=3364816 RepID=UPI0036E2F193